jgi:hypothetical protein
VGEQQWLTFDLFEGRVGEEFVVGEGGPQLSTALVGATEGHHPGGRGPDGVERQQFSLVFRGPAEVPLPQGTYTVTHAELGRLELFLVPIGADADGLRYEAAFS